MFHFISSCAYIVTAHVKALTEVVTTPVKPSVAVERIETILCRVLKTSSYTQLMETLAYIWSTTVLHDYYERANTTAYCTTGIVGQFTVGLCQSVY